MKIIVLLLTSLLVTSAAAAQSVTGSGTEADPWQIENLEQLQDIRNLMKGDGGYTAFRGPSLVRSNEGTLLAFTEGRLASWHDDAAMDDIILRRSTDGGETWGDIIVAATDGKNACKTPAPVVLPSGRILLVYTWNEYNPDFSRDTREVYVTHSDDDGLTWAEPRDITSMVYGDGWGWYATGPSRGIVKQHEPNKGRIIIPSRHNIRGGVRSMTSHIIYSDDGGENWEIGALMLRHPKSSNESQVVELSNGDIMMNSRNGTDGEIHRIVGISSDGGESFDSIELDTMLLDPPANASIVKHSVNEETGKYNILFANPRSGQSGVRVNGTLLLSEDEGQTWSRQYKFSGPYPTAAAYIAIEVINDEGDIGVLYETGRHYDSPIRYDGLAFTTISFDDITDPVTYEYPIETLAGPVLGKVPEDQQMIFDARDGYYVQTADIDASETENWNNGRGFIPIGEFEDTFTGVYDGNGYKIKNLTIADESISFTGLFGRFGAGTIKNVRLENVNIAGAGRNVGGLVSENRRGTIENSGVESGQVRMVTTNRQTGGLVGENMGGKITGSFAKAEVSGMRDVGGLVGLNDEGGIILNSYASGNVATVLGQGHDAGGLVGKNDNGSEIHNSFATGNVTILPDARRAGGLVGQNMGNGSVITNSYATGSVMGGDQYTGGFVGRSRHDVSISSSYSTGTVNASSSQGIQTAGGFVGESSSGSLILDSYWNTESSGNDKAVGEGDTDGEITGLTTAQMRGEAAPDHMPGLDFGELWQATEGYPMLFWQDGDEVTSGGEPGAGDELPGKFRLVQNYPNPFNPVTKIGFELPVSAEVRLEVYDVLGRRVAVLASGEYQSGRYEVSFNAGRLSSGVYLYRLSADGFTETRRMLLVK